ncbi:GTP cyclohydrolase [Thalassobacter stenotrophicus]|uniref:GTP cyclohydrolase II n=1 Tax=Thalassobacter TaxID=266808 RepID=UPI00051D2E67|nr:MULTISPECIES: GTP cyclohydrolase II [Thalassobacter]KGK78518.1 GTP cyclohydrolase [Thalassobacter stenotrophicus]KGL00752.1 GTP cyclohydrolase [Thalassobacter sp. 16PALIMAR09]
MILLPTPAELVARARADLRLGLPVVISDGPSRIILASVETVSSARLTEMRGLGELILCLSGRRAQTLKARAYDGDVARIVVPSEADLAWMQAVADPADDLRTPMKGPFKTLRTEGAAVWQAAVGLAKTAHLLPAVVGVDLNTPLDGLTVLTLNSVQQALVEASTLGQVVGAKLPMNAGRGRLEIFRPTDGGEEHYAVQIGLPDRAAPVLVRLHSACFTGDVLGSLKCDCGPQLRGALGQMGSEGAGVLLYLNQEGRGIGLANKMRAYDLQDQGFDTVEANHRLGFEDDERDFRLGAGILREMGITSVRLMTNNPAKIAMMQAQGIEVVERVPLQVGQTPENANYLAVKAAKSGHLL